MQQVTSPLNLNKLTKSTGFHSSQCAEAQV